MKIDPSGAANKEKAEKKHPESPKITPGDSQKIKVKLDAPKVIEVKKERPVSVEENSVQDEKPTKEVKILPKKEKIPTKVKESEKDEPKATEKSREHRKPQLPEDEKTPLATGT